MTKIILVFLFITSVISLAIILMKIIRLHYISNKLNNYLDRLNNLKINKFEDSDFLNLSQINFYNSFGDLHREIKGVLSDNKILDSSKIDYLDVFWSHSIDRFILRSEEYVIFLSMAATVSPLIGLFGTVWGLINAFLGIAKSNSASIVAIAPGIAEALSTTVAGLIVAIPATIGFNYIANLVRKEENLLSGIAIKYMDILLNRNN